jgi:predicted nucleic acid-binding protein
VNSYLKEGQASTTTVTRYELAKYAGGKMTPERQMSELLVQHSFSEEAADRASEIFNALKARGKMIKELDILIAAIALSKNEILITGDKEFKEIGNERIIVI